MNRIGSYTSAGAALAFLVCCGGNIDGPSRESSGESTTALSGSPSPLIALRVYNGDYVSAQDGGGGPPPFVGTGNMTADRTAIGDWEKFVLVPAAYGPDNHQFALQTFSKGVYLSAEGGGGGAVHANRISIGPWETFYVPNPNSAFLQFQTRNGHWLCAENGGGGVLDATRTSAAQWETFTAVPAQATNLGTNTTFTEPAFLVTDFLPCTPVTCVMQMSAEAKFTLSMVPNPNRIVRVGDDLAVDVSRVACVGECDNVETYNWDEITDNTGFDLKFWPNPSHPKASCAGDTSCFKRGSPWNEDCWTHNNVDRIFTVRSFPTVFTHHEIITYNLDFTCRQAMRDCQYQLNSDWKVQFLGCTSNLVQFGGSCDSNLWQGCQ